MPMVRSLPPGKGVEGVYTDWNRYNKLLEKGQTPDEAMVGASQWLPGSWLCKKLLRERYTELLYKYSIPADLAKRKLAAQFPESFEKCGGDLD